MKEYLHQAEFRFGRYFRDNANDEEDFWDVEVKVHVMMIQLKARLRN